MKYVFLAILVNILALPAVADTAITNAINAYRASQGSAPIGYSAKLEKAAQAHLNDIAARGVLSHTGRNGSTVGKRARRAGYRWCYVSENIAEGFNGFDRVLRGWQQSPAHNKNLLSRHAREMGIAQGPKGYWVQVFAAPC